MEYFKIHCTELKNGTVDFIYTSDIYDNISLSQTIISPSPRLFQYA